ncbi:MAG TPA: hypothetical protein VGG57_10025 [Stellaceae bacterium]|jgi:hypothetical protein
MKRAIFALVLLLAGGAAFGAAPAAQTPPAAPPASQTAPPLQLQGFRGAHWGMDQNEVKAAIRKDFNITPDKIQAEENASERTDVLSITVANLIQGAGEARVSYIFGFATKKLIQVNVIWGTPVDPKVKPDEVVAAANQLRDLFVSSGYEAASVHTNAATKDGTIVVFEGADAQKHATLLTLVNRTVPGAVKNGQHEPPTQTIVLSLSYVLDPQNPDVFRLKKGQF